MSKTNATKSKTHERDVSPMAGEAPLIEPPSSVLGPV